MNAMVQRLKEADEDFEWYPTTDYIIDRIALDMRESEYRNSAGGNFLDVGAGDGRVLTKIKAKLTDREDDYRTMNIDLFAIEKSTILLTAMPKEIVILGTDFREQTLVDKPMKYIFSNPPYSEFEEWSVKLIREAASRYLYLVIPERWTNSEAIKKTIELRGADVESLGKHDFLNAERKARANVDIVKLYFPRASTDAFDKAIEDMMPELQEFDRAASLQEPDDPESRACQIIESGENLIESLVMAYDAEVARMIESYRSAVRIDVSILAELGVCKQGILVGIRNKIEHLKNKYWKTLFDRFAPISKRMASKQRKEFLDSLTGKSVIDFTESNIYSMLIWISKCANEHFDKQLIEFFKLLSNHCNVQNYKSNARTWGKSDWRYRRDEVNAPSHYKLEYRIVLENCGGIYDGEWSWEKSRYNGLTESAHNAVADSVTVANNLNFDSDDHPINYQWASNVQNKLLFGDGNPLVAVRAFKNGNMHMHFDQRLMLAINVEAGRLLGWLKGPEEAVAEMQLNDEDAEFVRETYGSMFRLAPSNICKLPDYSASEYGFSQLDLF